MLTETERQYGYFIGLERMVKIALAVYFGVLVTGLLIIAVGLNGFIEDMKAGNIRMLVFALFGTCGIFLGTFSFIEKVRWVSKFNLWLDRKFFNILDRSNTILFDTIVESANPGLFHSTLLTDNQRKRSFAQRIFQVLANQQHLFGLLLQTNILRFWIWYWVLLYGSLTFTLLTIVLFISVALGI